MNDLRFALRQFLKNPAFTAIAVITLALGIGANTAVFSVLNAVLLRPLPFWQPQNLVALGAYDLRERTDPETDLNSISYPDFADWRAQNRVFERVAVYTNQSVTTLTDGKEATHVQGEAVSADLFPLLGVQPVLGRTFLPNEDDPGNHVVILSAAFWQRRFGANPNIIGQSLTLDGQQFQVVGIMPPRFSFPISSVPPEGWTTISPLCQSKNGAQPMTEERSNNFLECVARLKPNVSIKQAQANIETISAALRQQYPDSNANVGAKVLPQVNAMIAGAHSALLMLCAMASCVLLVACVNVANLLLARSLSRHKEISIRAALVVVEIVLALVLLASAGLLVESFLRLQKVRPGFDPTNVITARVALPDANYGKPQQAGEFYKKLLVRVSILPGVNPAAAAWWIPLSGSEITFNFDVEERPLPKGQQPLAQVNVVTADYFKTMRVPLLRGRTFTDRDDRNARSVAIVSESFAK